MLKRVAFAVPLASLLLTACGGQEQVTFDTRATDIQSCIIGRWQELSINDMDDVSAGEFVFSADGNLYQEDVTELSFFEMLLASFNDPEELGATAVLTPRKWISVDDLILIGDIPGASVTVRGNTGESALADAYATLEPQTWDLSAVEYTGYNVHCDNGYMTEVVVDEIDNYNKNFMLNDDISVLTFDTDIRTYQPDTSRLVRQETQLMTLNNDGSFIVTNEITYPETPSQDSSGGIGGEYEFNDGKVILSFPHCDICPEIEFYDHGSVISETSIYMERL